MTQSLHELDAFTWDCIRSNVRRLLPRARASRTGAEELQAELLLRLLRSRPKFDPNRGAWTTFVQVVVEHEAHTIALRLVNRQARFQAAVRSSTARQCEATSDTALQVDDTRRLRHTGRAQRGPQECVELELDVRAAVEDCSTSDRAICEALQSHNKSEAARLLGISRQKLHRRILHLQCRFRKRELDGYL